MENFFGSDKAQGDVGVTNNGKSGKGTGSVSKNLVDSETAFGTGITAAGKGKGGGLAKMPTPKEVNGHGENEGK